MEKDLLLYSLEMQRKFIYDNIREGNNLQRAQSGNIAKRRTIENGEIKMIVENKGKLQLEPFNKNQDRAQTAAQSRVPIWRKTHKQKVDDKIESLFESYRMVDKAVANGGKLPQPEETDKYF